MLFFEEVRQNYRISVHCDNWQVVSLNHEYVKKI